MYRCSDHGPLDTIIVCYHYGPAKHSQNPTRKRSRYYSALNSRNDMHSQRQHYQWVKSLYQPHGSVICILCARSLACEYSRGIQITPFLSGASSFPRQDDICNRCMCSKILLTLNLCTVLFKSSKVGVYVYVF